MAEPASIRFNNPGAINGNATWVKSFPGFKGTQTIAGNNPIAIMATPEQGVALWWTLMKRYRAAGAKTVRQIIVRYGGGQANYESEYVPFVVKRSGLSPDREIDLDNDAVLLPFAKAMFLMEAGKPTPLTDEQILRGFKMGRQYSSGVKIPAEVPAGTAAGAVSGVYMHWLGAHPALSFAFAILTFAIVATIVSYLKRK